MGVFLMWPQSLTRSETTDQAGGRSSDFERQRRVSGRGNATATQSADDQSWSGATSAGPAT